jgi:hypothetical protein
MTYKKTKISTFLFFNSLLILHAQQTPSSSGGQANGTGGSVNFTIGQIDYTTNAGTNGSVAQGVQQPYEISIVSGIEEANGINLILTAYPNPTSEYVMLKVENYNTQNLSYSLYDINGKLLENKKIDGMETRIVLSDLPNAIYILKVTENKKEIKAFKIVKN